MGLKSFTECVAETDRQLQTFPGLFRRDGERSGRTHRHRQPLQELPRPTERGTFI